MSATSLPNPGNSCTPWADKILTECIGEELPPCQAACPLDIRVREKLRYLKEGKLTEALAVVLERCPFPGILGRICSRPCEGACTRARVDEAIAIAGLKRYLADLDPAAMLQVSPGPARPQPVAVVGGGPAGLMAAYELRRRGYPVTIFEAAQALGGALRLYLPPYRLPREVLDRELGLLAKLGVEVRLGTRLGREVELEELRRSFAAVFLALGVHTSLRLGVPGEDLAGVMDGLGFLKAVNSGQPPQVGPRLAVIGGGNVALDAARSARRQGTAQVTVICLETPEEMPAFPGEVTAAREEAVEIRHRWGVKRFLGEGGQVTGLELKAVARVFDGQGRFAPTYREDRLSQLPADLVIVAVGQAADPGVLAADLGSETGRLQVHPDTLQTQIPGVFAGGDLVTGPRTAVAALAAGRRAALALASFLENQPLPAPLPPLESRATGLVVDITGVAPAPRQPMPGLSPPGRLARPGAEVELGFSPEGAREEAARCLACVCSECVKHCTFLQHYVQTYPYTEKELVRLLAARGEAEPLLPYSCHLCGLCQAVCPQDLNAGWACLEHRRGLVAAGKGPLPQHRGIQNFVRWGTSPTFTLARPDPATGKAARVFFPGCSLPGHSPHLVRSAYDYLRSRLPSTGILLNCCGAPSLLLGEEAVWEQVAARVAADLEELGAREVIVACTHCLETLGRRLPEIQVRSIYEIMAELGLPRVSPGKGAAVFNVHDACGARHYPEIHAAVRRLVEELGHRYEEMPHARERSICCGAGGMVPAVNRELADRMRDFRLAEASHDLLTYCASCRARFAQAGRPALHVLELLFNPHWAKAKAAPPPGSLRRWWHRWALKRHFQKMG